MNVEDDLSPISDDDFGVPPRSEAEELAEKVDVPLEVAEQIAREEGSDTDDAAFVDSEWLRD